MPPSRTCLLRLLQDLPSHPPAVPQHFQAVFTVANKQRGTRIRSNPLTGVDFGAIVFVRQIFARTEMRTSEENVLASLCDDRY
jgi:hypothetical protein